MRKCLYLLVSLLLAGSVYGRLMLLRSDGRVMPLKSVKEAVLSHGYTKMKIDDAIRVDKAKTPDVFSQVEKGAKGVQMTLSYHGPSYWYCPYRAPGSLILGWFTPPAACSILAVRAEFYSDGQCKGYIWNSPFPYVAGMDQSAANDSIAKYFVFDPDSGYNPNGWVETPDVLAGPFVISSSGYGWVQVDLVPIDVGENSFFFGYILEEPTSGKPYPLSDNLTYQYLPARSYHYRTGSLYSGAAYFDWYFNLTGDPWGNYAGNWMLEVVVNVYGNPPPMVYHDQLPYTYYAGPYKVRALIIDYGTDDYPAGVDKVFLYYADPNVFDPQDPTTYDSVAMTLVSGAADSGVYEADLPALSLYEEWLYWIEARDVEPRTGTWPAPGRWAPAIMGRLSKTPYYSSLVVIPSTGVTDIYAVDDIMTNTFHQDYDFWFCEDWLYPDSSVINAYQCVEWWTWSDNYILQSESALRTFLDNGGKLFLTGQDVLYPFVGTYDTVMVTSGNFVYDYLKLEKVTDDNVCQEEPLTISGVSGDEITGEFVDSNWTLYYDPMDAWVGGDVWMGTAVPIEGAGVDTIFMDEYDNAVGFKYADASGYKYVLNYFQTDACVDTLTLHPVWGSYYGILSWDAQKLRMFMDNMMDWFGISKIGIDGAAIAVTAPEVAGLSRGYIAPVSVTVGNMGCDTHAYHVELHADIPFAYEWISSDASDTIDTSYILTIIQIDTSSPLASYMSEDVPFAPIYLWDTVIFKGSAETETVVIPPSSPVTLTGIINSEDTIVTYNNIAQFSVTIVPCTIDVYPVSLTGYAYANLSSVISVDVTQDGSDDITNVPVCICTSGGKWLEDTISSIGYGDIVTLAFEFTAGDTLDTIFFYAVTNAAGEENASNDTSAIYYLVPVAYYDAFVCSLKTPVTVHYGDTNTAEVKVGNYNSYDREFKVAFTVTHEGTILVAADTQDVLIGRLDTTTVTFNWVSNVWEEGAAYDLTATVIMDGDAVADNNTVTKTVYQVAIAEVKPQFVLYPSYPNPMTRKAVIRFGVPERTHVSLKIYDITGRLVRTLKDATLDAGYYTVIWDGRDNKGRPVATGVYFYRLEAAGKIATKKLVRLK